MKIYLAAILAITAIAAPAVSLIGNPKQIHNCTKTMFQAAVKLRGCNFGRTKELDTSPEKWFPLREDITYKDAVKALAALSDGKGPLYYGRFLRDSNVDSKIDKTKVRIPFTQARFF